MSEEIKLKPCPLCGGAASLGTVEGERVVLRVFVRCVDSKNKAAIGIACGIELRDINDLLAVERWNALSRKPLFPQGHC